MGEIDDALKHQSRIESEKAKAQKRLERVNLDHVSLKIVAETPTEWERLVADFVDKNRAWSKLWLDRTNGKLYDTMTAAKRNDGIIRRSASVVINAVRWRRRTFSREFQEVRWTGLQVPLDVDDRTTVVGIIREHPGLVSFAAVGRRPRGGSEQEVLKRAMVRRLMGE